MPSGKVTAGQNQVRVRICPVCGSRLPGPSALKQHMAAAHGPSMGAKTTRKRSRREGIQKNSASKIESGKDMIYMSSVTAPGKVGDMVLERMVSPSTMSLTRLYHLSQLWTRWRPKRLLLTIRPSASYMVSGKYMVCWTPDPYFNVSESVEGVIRASTLSVSKEESMSKPVSVNIPLNSSRKWYDLRGGTWTDCYHGKIFVILSAPIGGYTGEITFSVHLDWAFEFDGPEVPMEETDAQVRVDQGYEKYFTDSTGDWAGGRFLTLKAHEGGDACRFSSAKLEYIYRLSPSAKLPVYVSTNKIDYIRFAAVVKDYSGGRIFAVFTTESAAENYLRSGNQQYLLPFYKQGDYVQPDNPFWFPYRKVEVSGSVPDLEQRLDKLEAMINEVTLGLNDKVEKLCGLLRASTVSSPDMLKDYPMPGNEPGGC